MNMHLFLQLKFTMQYQSQSGFCVLMHLHQKRPVKRAGEAGIALRAGRGDKINLARLCASSRRAER